MDAFSTWRLWRAEWWCSCHWKKDKSACIESQEPEFAYNVPRAHSSDPSPKGYICNKKKKVSDQGGFEAREDKGERSVEILNIMAYL